METTHLVTEFITHTGANAQDAVSCLKTWEWDLKKALIDYNDTSTTEYFNNKKNDNELLMKAQTVGTTLSPCSQSLVSGAPSALVSCSSALPYGNQQHHRNSSINSGNLHHHHPGSKPKATIANEYHHHHGITSSVPVAGSGGTAATASSMLKPILIKTDSVDIFDCKKLERGISRATENVNLVSRARQEFEMDLHAHIHEQNDKNLNFIDTPDYTFTLPDLTKYAEEFRKFLEKDLIESTTQNSLEATNRLNWWYDSGACRKLWPLATTGDGNCLLHAASLAMWGFHDRRLTLRRTLHDILSKEEFREALYRRWRFQQTRVNRQAGFVFCESEWAKEWEEIVAIASPEPRRNSKGTVPSRRRSLLIEKSASDVTGGATTADDENATYESLEEIHVLALAHILRRTIIVVSDVFLRDMNGDAFSPIPFGGVYLPFEVPSNECHRAPLLLAYDMAHFSALVAMETANDYPPALIPLVDASNQLLPIQFCIDPGRDFNWREYDGSDGNWTLTDREHIALLKEYLDIVYATGLDSPDEDIYYDDYSDEEYEKKIADGELTFADENHNNGTSVVSAMTASNQSLPPGSGNGSSGKSKAAKQLQSVAKSFGSIGKSMGKKLRKNIGSITRIGSKNSGKKPLATDKGGGRGDCPKLRILCAQLKARRHEYQEEMIKNYLECAQERYLEVEKQRERKELEKFSKYVAEVSHDTCDYGGNGAGTGALTIPDSGNVLGTDGELANCINAGCPNYGTADTSYMCRECYETQRQRESHCNPGTEYMPRYGTGKSKFYTEADLEAHERIQRLPSVRRLNELDQTLYLSRSTFYNDTKPDNRSSIYAAPSYSQGTIPIEYSSVSKHHGHHHHHFHNNDPAAHLPPRPPVVQHQTAASCAKQAAAVGATSALATATSGGIIATVYSPGSTVLNRGASMCVNLPPPAAPLSPPYQSASTGTSRCSLPNSSSSMSSSSSSTGSADNGKMQPPPPITGSSHHGRNQLCRTEGCNFYGSINTNFYCSKCFHE